MADEVVREKWTRFQRGVRLMSKVLFASAGDQELLCRVETPCVRPWRLDSLRIVAFSDYRVQDIALLVDFVKSLRPAPNLIVYAGDDVERFQDRGRNFFEELAATATHGVCAVVGNDPVEKRADQPAQQGTEAIRIRILDEVSASSLLYVCCKPTPWTSTLSTASS